MKDSSATCNVYFQSKIEMGSLNVKCFCNETENYIVLGYPLSSKTISQLLIKIIRGHSHGAAVH